MGRVRARLVGAVVVAAGILVFGGGPASAHAALVASDPANGAVLDVSPSVVVLTFDEVVRVPPNGVGTYDASGRPLHTEVRVHDELVSATLPPHLAQGTYALTWRVVSLDGHIVAGSLSFSMGAPNIAATREPDPATTDPTLTRLVAVASGLNYLGLFLAGGLTLFVRWVVGGVRLERDRDRRLASTAWIATALSIMTAALLVTARGAERLGLGIAGLGRPPSVDLHLGVSDLVVLVLQAVAFPAGLILRRRWAATGAVLLGLLSPALVGHSRTTTPEWVGVAGDLAHVTAGAVWLGGLIGLVLVLPTLHHRPHDSATLVGRFSTIGAATLAVLLGTGVFATWRIVGSWSALVHTTYGQLLLVKVGIVALAVVLAAFNRFILLPRVRVTGAQAAGLAASVRLLRRVVQTEACLLVAVLILTGFLTEQSPNEVLASQSDVTPSATTKISGDTVRVAIAPGRVGLNTLTVHVRGRTGGPARILGTPTVRASSGSVDLGTITVDRVEPGTYSAQVILAQAGTWSIQVGLRTSRFDDPVAILQVSVP